MDELRQALAIAKLAVPPDWRGIEVASRTPSGRVARLRLTGSLPVTVPADAFRLAVGRAIGWERIRSDQYDVRLSDKRILFHGYGAGHGVGLCQSGAARMGELGKRYDEILRFYYPGTALGMTARGMAWQSLAGERLLLLTTQPQTDGFLVGVAERWMRELEAETGWKYRAQPQIRIYPSVAVFRDATGEPGWVAASTRGRIIRMQPAATLRAAGTLDTTLRHELLHLLTEGRARPGLPLWFREGVALALLGPPVNAAGAAPLSDPEMLEHLLTTAKTQEESRRGYKLAQAQVEFLTAKFGKAQVLGWVERGLPPDLFAQLRERR
jgi:stage II sporulation protein D